MCVCERMSYPEAKVLSHVFKEAAHHGCQMNDVCWSVFLKHRFCLRYIPKPGREQNNSKVNSLHTRFLNTWIHD